MRAGAVEGLGAFGEDVIGVVPPEPIRHGQTTWVHGADAPAAVSGRGGRLLKAKRNGSKTITADGNANGRLRIAVGPRS